MYTPVKENLKVETLRLFQDYQKTSTPELRNQILELNFGLVRREAHHWTTQCNENYEDLLQVGCLGLIRAIERFELGKGHAFSSFAIPYIRGEIQHYLRDKGYSVRIPRRWLDLGRQAMIIRREFQTQFNRQPTDTEIAYGLEVSLKEWQEIKLAFQNREPLSLDVSINHDEEGQTSLADLVPDPKYRSFQLSQDDQIRLQQALSQLEERTRRVLEFVFLQDLTQREAAEQLGISVVTVSRRVKKGLDFLKETMKKEIF
ncbi:RNA polymerase, sigma 28 subunit, FliA/WhiG subfamily [Gloeothece citriformis PCC 7424]|uniref:RNA polymerase, sigma 28 subunit, FliA/WhiG subfamily n=1 Tax=Gloeothece citriformis (strain PCC 7424) TaxID=65393 RepID=B7KEG6_GLOC7|nr:RNA polymerase sigma factor SigF [Gloeothece citriformis]ACK73284.1 RNA polymerase, sigma 28 subunit, FliA/WhiG subfamily [Gloeothece citriformis PCC 7424]